MPEILIIDDILAPRDTLKLRYEGQNPFLIVTIVPRLLKDIMKIPGKDLLETDIRWGVDADPRMFYGVWMGKRTEDRWTQTRIRIIVQGEQLSKEKTGWVSVELKGFIMTKYQYTSFLQRSFWWFYNRTFYYKQRRNYLEFAKDNLFQIKERMQRALNIVPPET